MSNEAKETAEKIMRMIVDIVPVGANTDDMETSQWIVDLIAADYGLESIVEQLWADWLAKNGAAQDAWYGRT